MTEKKSSKSKKSGILNFEKTIQSLEITVSELESGELSLEDSIDKFEKGITLYKECKDILGKAEKRINVLTDSLKEEGLS